MRKRTFRILMGIAVVVLLLGLAYGVAVGVSTVKLRQAYAALRADGRPMDRKEVIPATVPDTENGALLYESAACLLRAQPVGKSLESRPGGSIRDQREREKHKDLLGRLGSLCMELDRDTLTPERSQELKELMSRKVVEDALSIVKQGAQRPACWQQRNYDAGMGMLMPGLTDARDLAYVVGVKARLETEAGAMNEAWQWAAVQAKLADAYRNDPILISQMLRMHIVNLSCRTIQRLCEIAAPNTEQREHVETILSTLDDITPLFLAMDGERLLYGEWLFTLSKQDLYRQLGGFDLAGDHLPKIVFWWRAKWLTFKPFLLADHANYIRIMHEGLEDLQRPYSPQSRKEDYGHLTLTHMLVPGIGRMKTLHYQMAAEVRMTRAGLVLLQYRAEHGTFPATLDALNLDSLSDPFTQGPLHYHAEGDGFLLYSVAEDQKDNGGAPRPKRQDSDPTNKRQTEYDIAWRFPSQTRQAAQ
jgi:hypothetical protein